MTPLSGGEKRANRSTASGTVGACFFGFQCFRSTFDRIIVVLGLCRHLCVCVCLCVCVTIDIYSQVTAIHVLAEAVVDVLLALIYFFKSLFRRSVVGPQAGSVSCQILFYC